MSAPHSCVSSIWLVLLGRRPSQQQQAADGGQITPLSAVQTKGPKRPLSALLDIRQLHRLATSSISAPALLKECANKLAAHSFVKNFVKFGRRRHTTASCHTEDWPFIRACPPPPPQQLLCRDRDNSAPATRRGSLTFAGVTMLSLCSPSSSYQPSIYLWVGGCRGKLMYFTQSWK